MCLVGDNLPKESLPLRCSTNCLLKKILSTSSLKTRVVSKYMRRYFLMNILNKLAIYDPVHWKEIQSQDSEKVTKFWAVEYPIEKS